MMVFDNFDGLIGRSHDIHENNLPLSVTNQYILRFKRMYSYRRYCIRLELLPFFFENLVFFLGASVIHQELADAVPYHYEIIIHCYACSLPVISLLLHAYLLIYVH